MVGLKNIRKKCKLTRKIFAQKLLVSEKTIYQYETGKRDPSIEMLKKMAQFFNCTIDELI